MKRSVSRRPYATSGSNRNKIKKLPVSAELEVSLTCSQKPTTRPESDESENIVEVHFSKLKYTSF
jgi:hypothetical protein